MKDISEYVNKIVSGDCVEVMKSMPNDCVDMIMTSPPYNYKDFSLDFSIIGNQFFRVLKDGGIAAVVIQDQTEYCVKKTLTSFRMTIDWCDNIGFKLFECVIYKRLGPPVEICFNKFRLDHEYIMLFLKGSRPMHFKNKPIKAFNNDIKNAFENEEIDLCESRGTVWSCESDDSKSKLKYLHPAAYPNKLPYDLIECFLPFEWYCFRPFYREWNNGISGKSVELQLYRN